MIPQDIVERLDQEYDRDSGFVGQLRYGRFDRDAHERLIALLKSCPPFQDDDVPAALVRLLWFMPWVVEWQVQRLAREGKPTTDVSNAGNAIFSELERILGVP